MSLILIPNKKYLHPSRLLKTTAGKSNPNPFLWPITHIRYLKPHNKCDTYSQRRNAMHFSLPAPYSQSYNPSTLIFPNSSLGLLRLILRSRSSLLLLIPPLDLLLLNGLLIRPLLLSLLRRLDAQRPSNHAFRNRICFLGPGTSTPAPTPLRSCIACTVAIRTGEGGLAAVAVAGGDGRGGWCVGVVC